MGTSPGGDANGLGFGVDPGIFKGNRVHRSLRCPDRQKALHLHRGRPEVMVPGASSRWPYARGIPPALLRVSGNSRLAHGRPSEAAGKAAP